MSWIKMNSSQTLKITVHVSLYQTLHPPPPPPDSAKEMPGLQMCWLHFTHVIPQIQERVEN